MYFSGLKQPEAWPVFHMGQTATTGGDINFIQLTLTPSKENTDRFSNFGRTLGPRDDLTTDGSPITDKY
ncbi:hypothetical protein N7501_006172 [Penicillium viridicatum]|nr:hypothetical protein N7501_006172 [Penicillium viridicatum]